MGTCRVVQLARPHRHWAGSITAISANEPRKRFRPKPRRYTAITPELVSLVVGTKATKIAVQSQIRDSYKSARLSTVLASAVPLTLPLAMLSTASKTEIDIRLTAAQAASSPISPEGTIVPSEPNTRSPSLQSLHDDKLSSPASPSDKNDDCDCPTPSTLVDGKNTLKSPEPLDLPPILQTIEIELPDRPYSAFSNKMKWIIALLCGAGAIISPLSSNIFVPAIPSMADAFGHSEEHIALGVSVYLVFQAITPSFLGAASDSFGRRPVYLATMFLYLMANVGLAMTPTDAYWLLLLMRALQATGGSAVISIGAGAISDIAEPRERGKFMSIFQCGVMLGPSIGPLLGGAFSHSLGWRAIFWFLTILTGCMLIPFFLIYPETLRPIVGDGSVTPPRINRGPFYGFQHKIMEKRLESEGLKGVPQILPKRRQFDPLSTFKILLVPEILLTFIVSSIPYVEFYCCLTIFSTVLKEKYGLNDLMVGLCYLPSGAGTIISTILNGKQVDYFYRREEKRCGGDHRVRPDFRVELTRHRCLWPFIFGFCLTAIAFGWAMEYTAPLAVVLILQFLIGCGTNFNSTVTIYGQDVVPGRGGAVSASLNLVRCALAAVGTATVQLMYNAMGVGWTFVLLSGLSLVVLPLSFLVVARGGKWRERRKDRWAEKKGRKAEAERNDNAIERVVSEVAESPDTLVQGTPRSSYEKKIPGTQEKLPEKLPEATV